MKTPKYKAVVYLAQEIDGPQGKGLACLETRPSFDKDGVVNYARKLHELGIALAYRICYSPDGNLENWYNDVEVVFLPDWNLPLYSIMPE